MQIVEPALAEFVSAGFLVTREIGGSEESPGPLPLRIVSASSCLAPFAPDTWCLAWTQDSSARKSEKAAAFGLDSCSLAELTAWATSRFGDSLRWPNVMVDLDTACELVSRFLAPLPDIRVLELALHRSLVEGFCRKAQPPPQLPGFAPVGRQGIHEVLLEGRGPLPSGNMLGFEPLEFEHSLGCSWRCEGWEEVAKQELGLRENSHGLISTFGDAIACVECIVQRRPPAEQSLWLPWLILDHTPRAS